MLNMLVGVLQFFLEVDDLALLVIHDGKFGVDVLGGDI